MRFFTLPQPIGIAVVYCQHLLQIGWTPRVCRTSILVLSGSFEHICWSLALLSVQRVECLIAAQLEIAHIRNRPYEAWATMVWSGYSPTQAAKEDNIVSGIHQLISISSENQKCPDFTVQTASVSNRSRLPGHGPGCNRNRSSCLAIQP